MNDINKIPAYFYFICLMLLLSTCQKEIIATREYPRLDIDNNIIQNGSSAAFTGNVISRGNSDVIDKGFVWSRNGTPSILSSRISIGKQMGIGSFNGTADIDFVKDAEYKVMAYIKTDQYLVYSKEITFKSNFNSPAPAISDFSPKLARWNDTIKIRGQHFSFLNENTKVFFGEISAQVLSCSDTLITAKVPDQKNGNSVFLKVKIYENTTTTAKEFKYINPEIQVFAPVHGTFRDTLTISGTDFPTNSAYYAVTIGGIKTNVVKFESTWAKVIVPAEITMPDPEIVVTIAGVSKNFGNKFLIDPPKITSFTPGEVLLPTNIISINGNNFNPVAAYDSVSIGGYPTKVIDASGTLIHVKIPDELIRDPYISVFDTLAVKVRTAKQTSLAKDSLHLSYASRWTRKRDFPGAPRIFGVSFGYKNKGYYGLGSYDSYSKHYNDFWEYNPDNDTWTEKSKFPGTARGLAAYFVIDGKVYVCCGTTENQYTESTNLNEVWEYNADTDKWNRKNDFPGGPRYKPFGFAANGKGYVGAGIFGNYNVKRDFWEYNPSNDSWIQKKDLDVTNDYENINAFDINGSGYLLGVVYGSPANCREFWKYDASADNWAQVSLMPGPYVEVTGFGLNGKLYVGTGIFSSFGGTQDLSMYNSQTNTWSGIGFKGIERNAANSFSVGNYGYILGGKHYSHQADLVDVWMFDPTKP